MPVPGEQTGKPVVAAIHEQHPETGSDRRGPFVRHWVRIAARHERNVGIAYRLRMSRRLTAPTPDRPHLC